MLIAFDRYLIKVDDELEIIKKETDRKKWEEYHEKYITDSRDLIGNLIVILTNDYSLEGIDTQRNKSRIFEIIDGR